MRKLALSDEILMKVDKPARYIGNEFNSVMKDTSQVNIRFAMCFPDVYEIGMSHLGIQILYDMFNRMDDVWCERVYSPWPDLHEIMKQENIPLFGLESQEPIKDFDFVAMTLQYEMCYTNILQILDLAQIPLRSRDREDGCPIVIAGGPCTYNPEPIADFFDIFYIGEGETQYGNLFELYKKAKADGLSREEFLHEAAKIEGLYVPALYEVEYNEDGTICCMKPKYDDIPVKIKKQVQVDLTNSTYPEAPVVPFIKATQDRMVLEIQRGCIRGCRFCQAGMIYRPVREKSEKKLQEIADTLIRNTGYNEISLMSLSSADYSCLPELVDHLLETFKNRRVSVSLPSLRVDSFSIDIAKKIQQVRKSGLTLAPEAGTQRLRDVINKGVTEEDIMGACANAFKNGWSKVKLYFMMGLPTETDEDLKGIADLAMRIKELYHTIRGRNDCRITVSVASFVPKPFTPFQWMAQCSVEEIERKQQYLKSLFTDRHIKFAYHDAKTGRLEAVLARGDRQLSKVILKAWEKGCKYDSWTEFFDYDRWMDAFEECGVDPDLYASRKRDEYEAEPWDHIDCGVNKDYLRKEWRLAQRGVLTHDCRHLSCNGCAVCPVLDVKPIDHKEENAHEKTVFIYHER